MSKRRAVTIEEAERQLQEAVSAYTPAVRRDMLRVLMLPPDARAATIGRLHASASTRPFAELLIDCEEDRHIGLMLADVLKAMAPPPERR